MGQKLRWGVISTAGIAVRSVIPAIVQSSRDQIMNLSYIPMENVVMSMSLVRTLT
ncbi:hypothetical protein PASE110613_08735 [Paenibacillus sediminis]